MITCMLPVVTTLWHVFVLYVLKPKLYILSPVSLVRAGLCPQPWCWGALSAIHVVIILSPVRLYESMLAHEESA